MALPDYVRTAKEARSAAEAAYAASPSMDTFCARGEARDAYHAAMDRMREELASSESLNWDIAAPSAKTFLL